MVALTASSNPNTQTLMALPESELTRSVESRTFRQVRGLLVSHTADRVVLRGQSQSYYVKQLATHAVLDLLPGVAIENRINVTR